MFEKLLNGVARAKYALAVGVPCALASAVALAEGSQSTGVTPEIPEALQGLNITAIFSTLANQVGPAIAGGLGICLGIWGISFVWRKIRSTVF